jgi:methylglyoxal synthase
VPFQLEQEERREERLLALSYPSSPSKVQSVGPSIAFVAHEARVDDLLKLLFAHGPSFRRMRVSATDACARLLEEVGIFVEHLASESKGGVVSVARMVARGELNAVVFLRDPVSAKLREPEVESMLVLCDEYEVPLATNLASAQILLLFLSDWEFQLPSVHGQMGIFASSGTAALSGKAEPS